MNLNVDPLVTGPFIGAPNKSRIGSFTYGTYSLDTDTAFKAVVNTGVILPQFGISTRIPTAGQQAQVAFQYGPVPHHVTSIDSGSVIASMPVAMGVGVFGSGGTLRGTEMIQSAGDSPAGDKRWGLSFKDISTNVNTLGQTKYPSLAGSMPGFIYIWRPSTMTAVGYCASAYSYSANNWIPSFVNDQAWAQMWGGSAEWVCWYGGGPRTYEVNHIQDVVTYLAGDMLIIEYWAGARFSAQSASANVGACTLRGIIQFGGGTNNTGGSDIGATGLSAATYNTQIPLNSAYAGTVTVPVQGENPVGIPNLTDVSPGVGPHISLTFDNPVGMVGPTIGPASSGLGVTGATQIDATHIDLATDYPPVHPLGEATEVAPPADNVRHW